RTVAAATVRPETQPAGGEVGPNRLTCNPVRCVGG
ncbi:MAG: ABC transporter substrate-binding protein, partial [Betaproteobacteria bacterium]